MKISIGKITAPVGIKGELRVYPYIDDTAGFASVKKVEIDKKEYSLEKTRMQSGMLVVKLTEIADRNEAEKYRNKEILVEKEDFVLEEDSFFDVDLIGMRVEDEDGRFVGKITDVLHNAAQDLYQIKKEDGKSFLLPSVHQFVLNVDVDNLLMTVKLIEGIDLV